MTTKRKFQRLKDRTELSDPYHHIVLDHRDNIIKFYRTVEDKRPVIVYDLQEERLYAYPCKDFAANLSESSQVAVEQQYQKAIAEGKVVVFIKDNAKQRLRSYSIG